MTSCCSTSPRPPPALCSSSSNSCRSAFPRITSRPPHLRPRRFLSLSLPLCSGNKRADQLFVTVNSSIDKPKIDVSCGSLEENLAFPSLSKHSSTLLQLGAFFTSMGIDHHAALAVTGRNNYQEDLSWVLIQSGIVAVWYFLVMPPIVMNWLRLRWYKRKFFEMYLQFMFVFLFFPGILLWAPFLNFRRFPRDPSMKYPWSTPQEASTSSSIDT